MSESKQQNKGSKKNKGGNTPLATPAMRALFERLTKPAATHDVRTQFIDARVYLDSTRFVEERNALFLRMAVPLMPSAQLAPGDSVSHDHYGVPLLVTRDKNGGIHVFYNVCRHRGTRLVETNSVQSASRLVCPYHAWTYSLDGALLNIPKPDTFTNFDKTKYGLKAFAAIESGGLVWTRLDGEDVQVESLLGNISDDFHALGVDKAHVFKRRTHHVQANWKLIMDAFLESYHVQRLHKDTIAPFFEDAVTASDRVFHHFRSVVARKGYAQASALDSLEDLRFVMTFSYSLLPATVVVASPDYVNVMIIYPQNVDQTVVEDYMLIAQPPSSDEEFEHFATSFELLDGGVFSGEDFRAAQLAQQGLASGALDRLTLGSAEYGVADFHRTVDELIERAR